MDSLDNLLYMIEDCKKDVDRYLELENDIIQNLNIFVLQDTDDISIKERNLILSNPLIVIYLFIHYTDTNNYIKLDEKIMYDLQFNFNSNIFEYFKYLFNEYFGSDIIKLINNSLVIANIVKTQSNILYEIEEHIYYDSLSDQETIYYEDMMLIFNMLKRYNVNDCDFICPNVMRKEDLPKHDNKLAHLLAELKYDPINLNRMASMHISNALKEDKIDISMALKVMSMELEEIISTIFYVGDYQFLINKIELNEIDFESFIFGFVFDPYDYSIFNSLLSDCNVNVETIYGNNKYINQCMWVTRILREVMG